MAQPSVEIHIPCLNEEDNLQKLIDAIQSQTYSNWRVFIHDNGSTDQTPAIAAAAEASSLGRIRHIHYKKTQPPFGQGHRIAKFPHEAEFVWVRSANDLVGPRYLEQAVEVMLANPSVAIAYSHGYVVYTENLSVGYRAEAEIINTNGKSRLEAAVEVASRYTSPFSLWGLYRRSVYESLQLISCYGADHVWVCEAAICGDVIPIADICDYRIVSRPSGPYSNETLNDVYRLWDTHHELRTAGVRRDSMFMRADIDLPFTSMINGHMHMISALRMDDGEKSVFSDSIYKTLLSRFEILLNFEHEAFLNAYPQIIERLSSQASSGFVLKGALSSIDEALMSIIRINPKFAESARERKEHLMQKMTA